MSASMHFSEGVIRVSGELNAASVPQLLTDAQPLFQQSGKQVSIDLSDVSRADSSGLALLIDWMRSAQKQQQQLSFRRLPEQLLEMARVSGIEDILPLAE